MPDPARLEQMREMLAATTPLSGRMRTYEMSRKPRVEVLGEGCNMPVAVFGDLVDAVFFVEARKFVKEILDDR